MTYQPVTQEDIEAFLANPALDFLHAEGTKDATKRSYAWHSITLSRISKDSSSYKLFKDSQKKLRLKLIFERASFLSSNAK